MRIKHAVHFGFTTTNNEAEYETFQAGTRMATALGEAAIKIHMDLKLVALQITSEFTPK